MFYKGIYYKISLGFCSRYDAISKSYKKCFIRAFITKFLWVFVGVGFFASHSVLLVSDCARHDAILKICTKLFVFSGSYNAQLSTC